MKKFNWAAGLATAAVAAGVLAAPKARADDKSVCVGSYEQAQVLRRQSQFKQAREELRVCSRAACPALVRNDCMTWLEQVDSAYPTIVIRAEHEGVELANVRVIVDGDVRATRLDGKALELDPGEHALRFETNGEGPISMPLLIREGEKNRVVTVRFGAEKPSALPTAAGGGGSALAPTKLERAVPAGVYVFGATGIAGLVGFAVLGSVGKSKESSMASTCSPTCSQGDIDAVRTKYLIADISLGVGVASVGAAAIWYALRPSSSAEAGAAPLVSAAKSLVVVPRSGGGVLGFRAVF